MPLTLLRLGAGPSLSPLTQGEGLHRYAPSLRLRGEGWGEGSTLGLRLDDLK